MPASASPAACKCAAAIIIVITIGAFVASAVQRTQTAGKPSPGQTMEAMGPGAVDAAPLAQ